MNKQKQRHVCPRKICYLKIRPIRVFKQHDKRLIIKFSIKMPSVKAKDIVPEFVSDDVDVMVLSGLNYGHSCFYPTLKYCQEILHINVWLILLPNSYHSSHIKTLICKEILIDIMKKNTDLFTQIRTLYNMNTKVCWNDNDVLHARVSNFVITTMSYKNCVKDLVWNVHFCFGVTMADDTISLSQHISK